MTSRFDSLGSSGNSVAALWLGIAIAVVVGFIANLTATQYVAATLGYQGALGDSIATIGSTKFYAPYNWAVWLFQFGNSTDTRVNSPLWSAIWIVGVGTFLGFLAIPLVKSRAQKRHKSSEKDLHGSARWAKEEEIRTTGLLGAKSGVYVGGWVHPKRKAISYLRHNGPEHVLAFAPTRSGKGVGLVLPTLLSWPHSVVVYDIKGENWALTAGWRCEKAGNYCIKFSPTDAVGSACFNPLAEIRLGTPRDVSDAQNIADILVRPNGSASGGGENEHWVNSAFSLLTGVILHVCYSAANAGRTAELAEIAGTLTKPGQSLEETLQEMMLTSHDPNGRYKWRDVQGNATVGHPVVAEKAQEMLDKEEKERSGVLSTAKTLLALYSDPIVSRNIARSDFRIADLMNLDRPVSLYIVVPPSDQERLRPLTRLLFTQIVSRLTEKMEFADGRSMANYNHRLLLLIDEFPTLGKLEVFAKSLAFIAGYGIKAYLIAQDLSQIQDAYGDKESILSNCHVRIAYAPNKIETAELLSKMTGTATVLRETTSYSGSRGSMMLGQVTKNVEAIERPLLTADECMRLPGPKKDRAGNVTEAGDMLIFIAGQSPIYGKQILYFKDPTFSERAKIPAPGTDRPRDMARANAEQANVGCDTGGLPRSAPAVQKLKTASDADTRTLEPATTASDEIAEEPRLERIAKAVRPVAVPEVRAPTRARAPERAPIDEAVLQANPDLKHGAGTEVRPPRSTQR